IARAQLEGVFLFERSAVRRIGRDLVLSQMLAGIVRVVEKLRSQLQQTLLEERELRLVHVVPLGRLEEVFLAQVLDFFCHAFCCHAPTFRKCTVSRCHSRATVSRSFARSFSRPVSSINRRDAREKNCGREAYRMKPEIIAPTAVCKPSPEGKSDRRLSTFEDGGCSRRASATTA